MQVLRCIHALEGLLNPPKKGHFWRFWQWHQRLACYIGPSGLISVHKNSERKDFHAPRERVRV